MLLSVHVKSYSEQNLYSVFFSFLLTINLACFHCQMDFFSQSFLHTLLSNVMVIANYLFSFIVGSYSKGAGLREVKESAEVREVGTANTNGKCCKDKPTVALEPGVVTSS